MVAASKQTEQHEVSAENDAVLDSDREEKATENDEENNVDEVADLVKGNSRLVEE